MNYRTYTDHDEEAGTDEAGSLRREGITQLPGYESLQAHLRPARSEGQPTKDDIFDILRNPRRRYVLDYLGEHDGPVELSELAEALADYESEDVDYITHRDRKRAYVSLYQTHLPRLDRAGAVEYNQPRGRIERGPDYRYLEGYLHHSHEGTLLWHRLYLGGGVASITLLGIAQLMGFPLTVVPNAAWFALIVLMFGSVLLVHSTVARTELAD